MPNPEIRSSTINGSSTIKSILSVAQWAGPIILAIVFAYGASRATNAALEQRVLNNEAQIASLQRQVDADRDKFTGYISRDEFKYYMDVQTNTLKDIQENVRLLRQGK